VLGSWLREGALVRMRSLVVKAVRVWKNTRAPQISFVGRSREVEEDGRGDRGDAERAEGCVL
jgi:hypothetical protein